MLNCTKWYEKSLKSLWIQKQLTLLKLHFGMVALLQNYCIFSEHLFLRTPQAASVDWEIDFKKWEKVGFRSQQKYFYHLLCGLRASDCNQNLKMSQETSVCYLNFWNLFRTLNQTFWYSRGKIKVTLRPNGRETSKAHFWK